MEDIQKMVETNETSEWRRNLKQMNFWKIQVVNESMDEIIVVKTVRAKL